MGAIVNYAYNKIVKKNENFISVIIGGTGSGKSYSFISFAQKFQEKRPGSHIWIIFRHEELLNLLIPSKNNIKKGDVVIYEEMGISADHRKFWSITNDTIRYVSQIARNRNFCFLMNLPFLNLLDKDVLPLVHVLFQTFSKDAEKRMVKCRLLFNDVNYTTGKSYFKFPMLYVKEEKKWRKVKYIDFPHPIEEIKNGNINSLKEYEIIKNQFNNEIYKKLLDKSVKATSKLDKKSNATDIKKIGDKIINNLNKYIKEFPKYDIINISTIAIDFELGGPSSKLIKKYVENKLGIGYSGGKVDRIAYPIIKNKTRSKSRIIKRT